MKLVALDNNDIDKRKRKYKDMEDLATLKDGPEHELLSAGLKQQTLQLPLSVALG